MAKIPSMLGFLGSKLLAISLRSFRPARSLVLTLRIMILCGLAQGLWRSHSHNPQDAN
jgi:hypothetical protein